MSLTLLRTTNQINGKPPVTPCDFLGTDHRLASKLQEQLAGIAAAMPGFIFTFRVDATGHASFPFASAGIEELFGLQPEEILRDATALHARYHPDDLLRVLECVKVSRRTLNRFHLEVRVSHPQKGLRWVEIHSHPQPQTDGAIEWHGMMSDVTERKRMEDELRAQTIFQSTLLNSLKDVGMQLMVIENGRVIHLGNRKLGYEFGFTDAEIDAQPALAEFIHPDDRERVLDNYRRRLAGEAVVSSYEVGLITRRGERREFETAIAVVPGTQPVRVVAVGKDITARKQAEAALAYERDLLRTLLDHSPDYIYFKDTQSRFLKSSAALARLYEVTAPATLVGKTDCDFITEPHARKIFEEEQEIIRTGQPMIGKVEKGSRRRGGAEIWCLSTKMPFRDKEGKIIGTFGISKDITELKRIEQELAVREQEFRSLANNVPDNIARWDVEGRYLYLNPVLERTIGLSSADLIGKRVGFPGGRFKQVEMAIAQVVSTGQAQVVRQPVQVENGKVLIHDVSLAPERDAAGQIVSVLGIGRDMTEIYRLQDEVAAREQAFRSLAESSPDSVIRYDLDHRILYLNRNLVRTLKLTCENNAVGRRPIEVWPDGRFTVITDAAKQAVMTGNTETVELVWSPEPGQIEIVQICVVPERDTAGNIIGTIAFGRDITAIRAAEHRLAHLVANLPGIAYTFRLSPAGHGSFPFISPAIKKFYGLDPEDVKHDMKMIHMLAHPEDRPRIEAAVAKSARTMAPFHVEFRVCRPGFPECWLDARAMPEPEPDGGTRWNGIMLDITERRHMETALKKSEEEFRALAENAPDPILRYDRDGRRIYVNPAMVRLSGKSEKALLGVRPEDFPTVSAADNAAIVASVRQVVETGQPVECHVQFVTPDGQVRIFHNRCVAERTAEGSVASVLWVSADITELKRMGAQLEKERTTLRTFFNTLPDMVWMKDVEGKFLICNPVFESFFGAREAEIVGKTDFDFVDAGLASFFRQKDREAMAAGRPSANEEWVTFACDGRRALLETVKTPVCDQAGRVLGVLGIAHDITERKQTEDRLRAREEEFRALVENSPDVVVRYDRHCRRTYVNPAYERANGLTASQVLGKTPIEFSSPTTVAGKMAARIEMNLEKVIESGQFVKTDIEWQDGRGRLVCLEMLMVPEFAPDGVVASVLTISRDTTDLRDAMRKLAFKDFALRRVGEAMYLMDEDARFLDVNETACEMLGYTCEELVGRSVRDIDPVFDFEQSWKPFWQQLVRSRSVTLESRHRTKDGCIIEVEINANYIEFDGKSYDLAFARDITERKRLETELRSVLRHAQTIVSRAVVTAPVGWDQHPPEWSTSRFRWLRRFDDEATAQSILPLEVLPGETYSLAWDKAKHPDDMAAMDLRAARAFASGAQSFQQEFRAIDRLGKLHWFSQTANIETVSHGCWRVTVINMDITERQRLDEELAQMLRAVEQSPASIVITDTAGVIQYVNPKFTAVSGFSSAEVLGKTPRVLKGETTDAKFYRELWAAIASGHEWRGEFYNRKKNGELFWESALITPIFDKHGVITQYLAIKEDITVRRQLEEQLRQTQKMEAVGQLAGGVAHDFNNILSAILMQTEMINMEENLSPEVREAVTEVHANAKRAGQLTRQLLLFGRKQVIQPSNLDLNEIITNFSKMLRRLLREDTHLQLNLHPLPLSIHADAGMMEQVLMNLAVNAGDAMPNGGQLFIETTEKVVDEASSESHPDLSPGRYVCLSIRDTGTGIPAAVLPKIFDPFFTTKEVGKGTGLGLATVFSIVKQHRGSIEVSSRVGQGTHFQILLPASADAPAKPAGDPIKAKLLGGSECILLVEDERAVRAMFCAMLKRCGYQVLEAANGVEACQLWTIHRDQVAMLLTDLIMPGGISGRQLAQRLREDKPQLKIIFTSGYSADIAGQEVNQLDGEKFLAKPFQPHQLMETVRQVLDKESVCVSP